MYEASASEPTDVAKFFVEQAMLDQTTVCPLKIQKLLYYAQGYVLAIVEKPLFEDDIEAWQYGPVVPRVYHDLKENGSEPIPSDWCHAADWVPPFDEAATRVLLHVWHVHGSLPPGRLVHRTHREPPWKDAYRHGERRVISKDSLTKFFGNQRRTLTLETSGGPPKRTYFTRWSEFKDRPAPWLRASRTGAVVHVLEDEGESVQVEFGQHHTPDYYREDDDCEGQAEASSDW